MQDSEKARKYRQRVNEKAPKSHVFMQCVNAFWVGGLICCIGQALNLIGSELLWLDADDTSAFTSIVLIFLGAFLTGLGVYDKIGSFAGAGSIVPITGFANAVVSPAMEHKYEGYVLGVGAQLFSIAGPVLVYGITTSVIVGLIACIV